MRYVVAQESEAWYQVKKMRQSYGNAQAVIVVCRTEYVLHG